MPHAATCPANLKLFDFIAQIIIKEEYKLLKVYK
jgi:hypothetical protein